MSLFHSSKSTSRITEDKHGFRCNIDFELSTLAGNAHRTLFNYWCLKRLLELEYEIAGMKDDEVMAAYNLLEAATCFKHQPSSTASEK